MTDSSDTIHAPARARGDVAADRPCLRCGTVFHSEGFGERICPRCKGTVSWRTGLPYGNGKSRPRSGGRSS